MNNREIDYLIFEHVFNQEKGYVEWLKQNEPNEYGFSIVKNYSTDIKDAWSVVYQLKSKFEYFDLAFEDYEWSCEFGLNDYNGQSEVWNKSAPMAICLAALKSVGVEVMS